MAQRVQVWDVPTRVFHWLLALSFGSAFLTAESERYRDIHVMMGYTLLGLLVFRLLWGVWGTRHARFASFLFKPGEVVAYVSAWARGRAAHYAGHNPAGSVAIWLLLALGFASAVTGVLLFQDVGGDTLAEPHEVLSFAMLLVVALHLAGVVASSIMHRENLVRAMFSGLKEAEAEDGVDRSHGWLGVIMLLVVVTFWAGYSALGMMEFGDVVVQTPR